MILFGVAKLKEKGRCNRKTVVPKVNCAGCGQTNNGEADVGAGGSLEASS